jgi:hypothetical protein
MGVGWVFDTSGVGAARRDKLRTRSPGGDTKKAEPDR